MFKSLPTKPHAKPWPRSTHTTRSLADGKLRFPFRTPVIVSKTRGEGDERGAVGVCHAIEHHRSNSIRASTMCSAHVLLPITLVRAACTHRPRLIWRTLAYIARRGVFAHQQHSTTSKEAGVAHADPTAHATGRRPHELCVMSNHAAPVAIWTHAGSTGGVTATAAFGRHCVCAHVPRSVRDLIVPALNKLRECVGVEQVAPRCGGP